MPLEQSVAPVTGCVQVPSEPAPTVQMPPQQSPSCAHTSPFCTQNDDGPQNPAELHRAEQQSPSAAHGLPSVLQSGLSGVHVCAVASHAPPQHSPSCVHVPPSAVH